MASIITHYKTRIVTLEDGDNIAGCCHSGDIVIEHREDGWWTRFIGDDGHIDDYDEAFATERDALIAAKAAAEFGSE